MIGRRIVSTGVLVAVLLLGLLAPAATAGQAQTATADTWTPPRTAWGEPDLQGIWDFSTLTPLQRPSALTGKEFFTEEEAAAREQRAERRDRNRGLGWYDSRTLTEDRRSSLIVDPPDGRMPPLTPKAQGRTAAMRAAYLRLDHGPEDQTLWGRCILGRTSGPPMMPSLFTYDTLVQLFQTPGYVVLFNEIIHAVRIIPLDGRPHLGPHIRQWKGDSRGRWEGHTLVVETTNFSDPTHNAGLSFGQVANRIVLLGANLHVVERFTRVDADTITYEFTVDDPTTFTRPWSAVVPMKRTEGPLYEFACHEGNYSMAGGLSGARAEEAWPTIQVQGVDVVDAGAPVLLEAEAAAYGGARLELVEFLVDGAVVGVDREAPYEVTWTAGGAGRHLASATVHDSLGQVAQSAPVAVFIGLRALERSIDRSEDEAEELPAGSMLLDNPSRMGLGLGGRGGANRGVVSLLVGLRFTDIRIPRGTPIQAAHLQFTAGPPRTEPTALTLHAELAGDAVAFTEVRQNISVRQRTAASVNWSPEPWEVGRWPGFGVPGFRVPDAAYESSVRQRTPDLAALIQEVVDRPDWHDGNALVLLISGSGQRIVWSYGAARQEQRLEHAPRLYIELAEPSP